MQISKSVPGSDLGAIADMIVSNSFNSVMVTKAAAETPIVYVNEAFTQLTGYTYEEVLGKSPSLLQGADTDPRVLDQLRKDLGAGRNFRRFDHQLPQGRHAFHDALASRTSSIWRG